jgi:hypothetical protein
MPSPWLRPSSLPEQLRVFTVVLLLSTTSVLATALIKDLARRNSLLELERGTHDKAIARLRADHDRLLDHLNEARAEAEATLAPEEGPVGDPLA